MGRYKDNLYIKQVAESVQDANGDYTETVSPDWAYLSECRDEPSTSGRIVKGTDGEVREFETVIQLPEDCNEIDTGTPVQVRNASEEIVIESTAKRFKRYSNHCKLWV